MDDITHMEAGPGGDEGAESDLYRRMRTRMRAFARSKAGDKHVYLDYLMAAPDLLHLLGKLALDPSVAAGDKTRLGAIIAYYLNPFDLIPELLIGPLGYLDDVALAAYVLQRLVNLHPEAVQRHWAGDGNVIQLVQRIIASADKMLGQRVARRLSFLSRRDA